MKKPALIAIVAVVIIGIGLYFYQQKQQGNAPATTSDTSVAGQTQNGGGMQSLRGLLALGTSQSCTFSNTANGSKSEGTVYVAGGKMRGDFTSSVDATGKTMMSHMITDGKEMRFWQEGETMGFMMTIPDKGATSSAPSAASADTPQFDNQGSYACNPWVADESKFTAPTTVTFHSMTDMMKMRTPLGSDTDMGPSMEMSGKAAGSGGTTLTDAQQRALSCQACAAVKDPKAQAQCKAAFQCQ